MTIVKFYMLKLCQFCLYPPMYFDQAGVFTATFCNVTTCINTLKPSGYYMYHQFNIQQPYVLPTQCSYVFGVALRTTSQDLTGHLSLTRW
jgi:hypothetical protein